jgi:glycine/D-amino acid oxidase-like deaminating enzyme
VTGPLEIAIVGAGIHGSLIAVRLLDERPELRAGLRLIDPSGTCLAEWQRQTSGQGMEQMRSPVAHHLDVAPESLLGYARGHGRERELLRPYQRPSLAVFDDHCLSVIERWRLQELVVPGRVEAIVRMARGYRLELSTGTIESRALVLAPGLRGHERIPDWARPLVVSEPSRVRHAVDVVIDSEPVHAARVAVVGGGLSAATLTAGAVRRGAKVTLVSRRSLEARLFDTDPGWVGPKYLRWFHAEARPEARLRMIERARGRAAMTPELLDELDARRRAGSLEIVSGEVVAVRPEPAALSVRLSAQAAECRFEKIWLATGFAPAIERLEWLHGLGPLQCHRGRPILPPSLELAPDCFASGWLAELEVGPTARNISGARSAAARIAACVFAADRTRSAA